MQNYSNPLWLHVAKSAGLAETAVWPIPFLINMFAALKGSQLFAGVSGGFSRGSPVFAPPNDRPVSYELK